MLEKVQGFANENPKEQMKDQLKMQVKIHYWRHKMVAKGIRNVLQKAETYYEVEGMNKIRVGFCFR